MNLVSFANVRSILRRCLCIHHVVCLSCLLFWPVQKQSVNLNFPWQLLSAGCVIKFELFMGFLGLASFLLFHFNILLQVSPA